MKYTIAIIFTAFCFAVSAESKIPTIEIYPGVNLPMVGMGTWLQNETQAYNEVLAGLKLGNRAIDTAHDYDNAVGIQKAIAESGVAREDIFITTKVEGGLTPNQSVVHAQQQLDELKVDYVDLLLIHFPFDNNGSAFSPEGRKLQWQALESLFDQNKTRAIGVSHYCKSHLSELLEYARIKPALNQVEYHIGMGSAGPDATDSKEYCQSVNVTYAPFSELCGPCCMGQPKNCTYNMELITGEMVTSIGNKYNKSGPQVALRWLVQQGLPVIPKSNNPAHLAEDMDIFDFVLSDADMATLTKSPTPPVCGGGDGKTSGDCAFPKIEW